MYTTNCFYEYLRKFALTVKLYKQSVFQGTYV